MVCIKIRESSSYQDCANAYANGYGYGSLYIYGLWGLESQEVFQASKVTVVLCSEVVLIPQLPCSWLLED